MFENIIDLEIGEFYFKKIDVLFYGEGDDEGFVFFVLFKKVYEYVEEFINLLR